MNIVETLLTQLDETREELLVLIAELSDEELLLPNAIGKFSIADVLVNLTVWEAELVTGLMRVDQGKKPAALLAAMENRKAYNQKRYEENRGRDLDFVFDDLQKVRIQLETWLDTLPAKALADKKRYPWLNGRSLATLIEELTFKNEARYLPLIAGFVNQLEDRS